MKLSQLADDTTVFVSSKEEVSLSLNLIEIFGSLSGLKLNRNKTEGIWLGKLKSCRDKFENIKWNRGPVKCLGVYFGYDKDECKKMNMEKQFIKSEKIIHSWSKKHLTMMGRITVVKTLVLPNITYVATVTDISKDYISKFKKLIYNYIWENKSEKVKRSTLSKEYLY